MSLTFIGRYDARPGCGPRRTLAVLAKAPALKGRGYSTGTLRLASLVAVPLFSGCQHDADDANSSHESLVHSRAIRHKLGQISGAKTSQSATRASFGAGTRQAEPETRVSKGRVRSRGTTTNWWQATSRARRGGICRHHGAFLRVDSQSVCGRRAVSAVPCSAGKDYERHSLASRSGNICGRVDGELGCVFDADHPGMRCN